MLSEQIAGLRLNLTRDAKELHKKSLETIAPGLGPKGLASLPESEVKVKVKEVEVDTSICKAAGKDHQNARQLEEFASFLCIAEKTILFGWVAIASASNAVFYLYNNLIGGEIEYFNLEYSSAYNDINKEITSLHYDDEGIKDYKHALAASLNLIYRDPGSINTAVELGDNLLFYGAGHVLPTCKIYIDVKQEECIAHDTSLLLSDDSA